MLLYLLVCVNGPRLAHCIAARLRVTVTHLMVYILTTMTLQHWWVSVHIHINFDMPNIGQLSVVVMWLSCTAFKLQGVQDIESFAILGWDIESLIHLLLSRDIESLSHLLLSCKGFKTSQGKGLGGYCGLHRTQYHHNGPCNMGQQEVNQVVDPCCRLYTTNL